ncbi:hypothetical protein H9W90_02375 [Polaribacter pectinis]|uniref:Uncharacterized protein n=1 Tax=Polaribacter pectinis TaxID=2738844 RepID=A0A7G9LBI0_9FLAO|nr:hypothetical protein [Polaribacter pectinis]QNM85979.1 hypothetical protein H9W90_02375 [Polaribacter pectinis]
MKISTKYPNFKEALLFFINDKNYSLVSDDSIKLSFMIPLSSHKLGYDYYELNPTSNGGVIFEVVTTLGLKTIKKTSSPIINNDLSSKEWENIIFTLVMKHFSSEEYLALKNGYTKTNVGCFGVLLFFTLLLTQILK